jgi:hypothetical protein
MKLNMKSQRKQTHNTILTESGVFELLCINSQKEIVSITIDQKGPAYFLSSNYIFIQLLHARISIVPGVFSVTKGDLCVQIIFLCPLLGEWITFLSLNFGF